MIKKKTTHFHLCDFHTVASEELPYGLSVSSPQIRTMKDKAPNRLHLEMELPGVNRLLFLSLFLFNSGD